MKKYLAFLTAILLAGCGSQTSFPMMGGGDSGMMQRHHAQVPSEYAGMTSPEVTDESLVRGADVYKTNCISCHGETGLGDGPAGAALEPRPAEIAHSTQMLADDLLFYRVSEGGVPFQTAMPAWKGVLTEEQIWDVLAYVRTLGTGNSEQINQMRAQQQDAMLAEALGQDAITQEQADTFRTVHTALEDYMSSNSMQGDMTERENAALAALVESGQVTQEQVDEFQVVHAILASGGFMP
ncbi:MAG TPA: cytochrome c [Anaerolineales bacterium]|nr:cytochrome c [Anaerolineales bacterium]HNN14271.1 cytochrome c [Anaerolineales bacterium]